MSVFRVVGIVAVVASLAACASESVEATAEDEATSNTVSDLSDPGGMGTDVPVPQLPPGPWDNPNWKLPKRFERDRDHDPVGPMHRCVLDYLKIFDPARSGPVDVPIVRCE